jgi:hypothetical protein
MKRREVITFLGAAVLWPLTARAQTQATVNAAADNQVGQVATLQGSATVTRANAAAALLKVSDAIHKGDELQTGANSSLGITFDDETTLSLSANTRIVVNEFIYREGGKGNRGLFNAARGTLAFVAGLLAKSGEMKITTETAVIGIRGTTGVVDVPEGGAAGEAKIKLYPDADGRVGRLEVFNPQGGRLGTLTQGASAFAIRRGAGGQVAAVPFRIPPQEARATVPWCSGCSLRTTSAARWRSSEGSHAGSNSRTASPSGRDPTCPNAIPPCRKGGGRSRDGLRISNRNCAVHSALMFASLMTVPHFSISNLT